MCMPTTGLSKLYVWADAARYLEQSTAFIRNFEQATSY